MSEEANSRREAFNELIRKVENFSKVLQMSKTMQMRFSFLPTHKLNDVVRAGIKDMSLGRTVIRANHPAKHGKSIFDRITVDPKGFPNKNNLHVPVSASTVKALEYTQKGLIYTGQALFVLSILSSGTRIAKSLYDEIQSVKKALEEDLMNEKLENRRETRNALEFAKELLFLALNNEENFGKKTAYTAACVAGEYAGASVGGYGMSTAGASIGAVCGPIGSVAGAVVGGVIGATIGTETGASAVNNFKYKDKNVESTFDGILFDVDNRNGEVLGVHGNASIGKDGVDIGASGAIFDWADRERNSSVEILKTGANVEYGKNGVDIGVEGKLARIEHGNDKIGVGVGLSLDTGVKFKNDVSEIQFLGFGYSTSEKGSTLKSPFLDFTYKNRNEKSKI